MSGATLQRGSLRRGQVVTLLVGVGLELISLHASGRVFGPVHPAHVVIEAGGRPRLRSATTPPQWTPHDDWVGLLRLGRSMGRAGDADELSWWTVGQREGCDLLQWLMEWASPEPLPGAGQSCGSDRSWWRRWA